MKKLFLTAFLSLGLLTACSTASQESVSTSDEVIKIGFFGPLTGDVAGLGQDDKSTVELFLNENPSFAGKKVKLVFEDSQCNGQKGASAAEKLIAVDKVQLILGGVCSGETLGAAPIVERNQVVLISSISTSPQVTTAGEYVFRNAPSDATSSVVMTASLSKKFKKVAIISQNNDFSQAYLEALQEKLPEAGVEIVVSETFNSGTTDFKTVLGKVKKSSAEVLVNLAGETSAGGFISRQAKEIGLNLPIYGTDAIAGKEFFDIAKDAAEGTIIVITAADKGKPEVAKLLKKFQEFTGHEAVAEAYVVLTWDRLNIVKNAIESVGYDAAKIKDYLYKMPAYTGLGGKTKFDSSGDVNLLPSLLVAKDGKFELLK